MPDSPYGSAAEKWNLATGNWVKLISQRWSISLVICFR